MPQLNAKVPVVTQRLEGEIVSGEVLGFPEVSCCDHDLDEVRNQLIENVLRWLSDLENAELHRHWIPSDVTPFEVRVLFETSRRPGFGRRRQNCSSLRRLKNWIDCIAGSRRTPPFPVGRCGSCRTCDAINRGVGFQPAKIRPLNCQVIANEMRTWKAGRLEAYPTN